MPGHRPIKESETRRVAHLLSSYSTVHSSRSLSYTQPSMVPDRLPLQPPPPPQRPTTTTSQSFALSAALNLPLSSTGPQHAPSLTRGMVRPLSGIVDMPSECEGPRSKSLQSTFGHDQGSMVEGGRCSRLSTGFHHRGLLADICALSCVGLFDLQVPEGEYTRFRSVTSSLVSLLREIATRRALAAIDSGGEVGGQVQVGTELTSFYAPQIKCDGVQPACSACRRSASAKGEYVASLPLILTSCIILTPFELCRDPDLVMCNFDAPEQRRKPVGGGKVAGLEAKMYALIRSWAPTPALDCR